MSHEATNWAVKQRGIKPSAKIVLWHLADRHHPDFGCFPSHKTLAEDCEMSERSVRDQLRQLESLGLIRREKTKGKDGQFSSDRYELAFEFNDHVEPENDHSCQRQNLPTAKSASGKNECEPAANSRQNQRQNLPPNPVRVTSNKTSKSARGARLPDDWVLSRALGEFAIEQGLTEFEVRREADRFRDYWVAAPGSKGVKKDWSATWRNWVRSAIERRDERLSKQSGGDKAARYRRMG